MGIGLFKSIEIADGLLPFASVRFPATVMPFGSFGRNCNLLIKSEINEKRK